MGNRLLIANGNSGIVIANHTNKTSPTFVGNRAFDNSGSLGFGSIVTYKGSACAIVYFESTISGQLRKFVLTATLSPSPEGQGAALPPFPVMELFEVTSETLPTRLQRVEIRGNITDWNTLPSVAFGLVRSYLHVADGKRFFVHVDGFQEGSTKMDEIPTQYWEVLCEWIPSLSCGTEIPNFNFDPEYFSIWEWIPADIATFPVAGGGIVGGKPQPLARRGNQQQWSQPAIRQISVPSPGHIFILETRFAIIPSEQFTQLVGSHLLYAHHAKATDSTVVTGPVTVNRTDRKLIPFSLSGINATFDVDSQFYVHFCYANVVGIYKVYQLSQGDMGGGITGYNLINPVAYSSIQFPIEFSGTILKKMVRYIVVHGNYAYIFYTATLDSSPLQKTPCLTVIDITTRTAPVHKWDVSFPTLVDPSDNQAIVWDGRMQPDRDSKYIYVPAGNNGIAIIDISCIDKSHPTLAATFSLFGTITYPAGHPQSGQPIAPPTNMPIEAIGVTVNTVDPIVEDCAGVPIDPRTEENLAIIPSYKPFEVHGDLWRGLELDTAEIIKLNVGKIADRFFQSRVVEHNTETGVTHVELFPHRPEKIGRWVTEGSDNQWNPLDTAKKLENYGFMYSSNEIKLDINNKLIYSRDGGLTWKVCQFQVGKFDTLSSLLNRIKTDFNASTNIEYPGFGVMDTIERTSDFKIKMTFSGAGVTFNFETLVIGGMTKANLLISGAFGQLVIGATVNVNIGPFLDITFPNRVLYSFDATYAGSYDLSRWG